MPCLFFPSLRYVALFASLNTVVIGWALLPTHVAEAQSIHAGEEALAAENYEQAHQIFELLAEDGSAHAQYRMGYLHQTGSGVPKNDDAAYSWYYRVLEHDTDNPPENTPYDPVARAYNNLAVLYSTGGSIGRDCERAYEYYRASARRGLPEGQYGMATMLTGDACFNDAHDDMTVQLMAVQLYQEAASAGLAEAQYKLGVHYCTGRGVEQSHATAAIWWREAATQGYRRAQIRLADRYMQGNGLPQDDVQAYVWLSRAIANTCCGTDVAEGVQDALLQLKSRMNEEQRTRAEAMLHEALPGSDPAVRPTDSGE